MALIVLVLFQIQLSNFSAMKRHPMDAELKPLLRLGAGACAGIIAMSATYPMDMTDKSQYRESSMLLKQFSLKKDLVHCIKDGFLLSSELYVDDSLRIGRDDKGNIFILEKD